MLKPLTEWMEHGAHQDCAWTSDMVLRYLVFLKRDWRKRDGKPLAASSLKGHRQSLHTFLKWLHSEGRTATDLSAHVKKQRVPEPIPATLTNADIHGLIASASEGRYALRDVAMLMVLIDSGMRAGELCSITLKDIDMVQRLVFVRHGKGAKSRHVPFSKRTATAITTYIGGARPQDAEALFVSQTGDHLTVGALNKLFQRIGQRAGIEGIHTHQFRHTFATRMLLDDTPTLTLQRFMGHSTPDMTARYARSSTSDLQAAHARHSPMNALFGD